MGKPMPGWTWRYSTRTSSRWTGRASDRSSACLHQPALSARLLDNDEATVETFGGEWFHTKDAAVRDEDGYIWYVGCVNDVIIAAGYPDTSLRGRIGVPLHPAVREAAVVASPDELRGNVVKAFIVLADGYQPSDALSDEIKGHVRERLSDEYVVQFVPKLPKQALTASVDRAAPTRSSSAQIDTNS